MATTKTTTAKTSAPVDTSRVIAGKVGIDTAELNKALHKAQSLRGRLQDKHGQDFGDARKTGVEIPPEVLKLCTTDERKLLRLLSAHNTLARFVNA